MEVKIHWIWLLNILPYKNNADYHLDVLFDLNSIHSERTILPNKNWFRLWTIVVRYYSKLPIWIIDVLQTTHFMLQIHLNCTIFVFVCCFGPQVMIVSLTTKCHWVQAAGSRLLYFTCIKMDKSPSSLNAVPNAM